MAQQQPDLPEGWFVGAPVADESRYGDPPVSTDAKQNHVFAFSEHEDLLRLYTIPAYTPVGDIVRFFKVGSHGAESYRYDAEEGLDLVIELLADVESVIPGRVIYADPAGLKMRFVRPVTQDDLRKMDALLPEDVMKAGLESYASEWDGEGSILSPLLKDNLLHLWWD
jgi:hypothetical protein